MNHPPPAGLRIPTAPANSLRYRVDSKSRVPCRPQGMLVLRCRLAGQPVYVVEIGRRTDESGLPSELFWGLVFVVRSVRELGPWLRRLLSGLSATRGVFDSFLDSFLDSCPGRAIVFHHPPRDSGKFSQLAARNALSKMQGLVRI